MTSTFALNAATHAVRRSPKSQWAAAAVASSLPRLPIAIPKAFIGDILEPYRPNARYLRAATIDGFQDKRLQAPTGKDAGLVAASGRFSIPESCYIDDTGHFNAVEFNICFNQLAYVVFGKCIEDGILHQLRLEASSFSFADFKRHQLSSMLIVKVESRYYKQMRSDDFTGHLRIERISASAGAYFCFTSITFADSEGVKCKGTVLLAYSPAEGASHG